MVLLALCGVGGGGGRGSLRSSEDNSLTAPDGSLAGSCVFADADARSCERRRRREERCAFAPCDMTDGLGAAAAGTGFGAGFGATFGTGFESRAGVAFGAAFGAATAPAGASVGAGGGGGIRLILTACFGFG